ncbi:MAG: ATP-binding protein [Marinoscillum sp.]
MARTAFINAFGLILMLVCLVYGVIFNYIGESFYASCVYILGFISLIPLILNRTFKYNIARIAYIFICPTLVMGFTFLLGPDLGIHYFFILIYAFPVVFLKPNERFLALMLFIFNSICLLYYEFGNLNLFQVITMGEDLTLAVHLTALIIMIYFSFILYYTYYQIVIKNEQKLIKTNLDIEKAHQVKQEFLATMSHELRTPLNAVVTITTLLDENPNHKDKLTFFKLLKHSSQNLLSIVNDILDFSKLEANKMKVESRTQEIRVTLKNIVDTYANMAEEKGLKLVLTVDNEMSKLYKLDDIKLSQILGNLISNAIKYTNQGEIKVTVNKTQTEGLFDQIYFEVADTGEGISRDDLQNIFESFTQIKSVLTRQTGGTGLGLAIVKRLLNLQGSDIGVESEIGNGSKFYFSLKLKSTNRINEPKNKKFKITNEKRVLLVEDNVVNAMVAEKLLENWGLKIEKAENGEIAVKACETNTYDLILMDLHMPVMDGFQAAETIRNSNTSNRFVPIYALTADVMGENNSVYNKYFDGFITKPIQKDKLQRMLMTRLAE